MLKTKQTVISLIILLFFVGLFVPAFEPVSAESLPPAMNPLCWKEKDCIAKRMELNDGMKESAAKTGCIKDNPCNVSGYCKCLSGTKLANSIAIGGKSTFAHIGEYLLTVFNYAIIIAGILAVLVVVVAGLQWMTSGGNSDTISRAKKRIGGAFIGLFIAYGSYFILATINPQLVSLKIPQPYMVKPFSIMNKYCSQLPPSTKMAVVAQANEQAKDVSNTTEKLQYDYSYDYAKSKDRLDWFACGKRFKSEKYGNTTCFGDYCKEGSVCVDFGSNDTVNKAVNCKQGLIVGRLFGKDGFAAMADDGDEILLLAVCETGKIIEVGKTKIQGKSSNAGGATYSIKADPKKLDTICLDNKNGGAPPMGFFLSVEVNDQQAAGGSIIAGMLSTGKDDNYPVGQTGLFSHTCSVNLAKTFYESKCGPGNLFCGCSFLTSDQKILDDKGKELVDAQGKPTNETLASKAFYKLQMKHLLLTSKELKAGYYCDIILNRTEFPAITTFDSVKRFKENLTASWKLLIPYYGVGSQIYRNYQNAYDLILKGSACKY